MGWFWEGVGVLQAVSDKAGFDKAGAFGYPTRCRLQPAALLSHCSPMAGTEKANRKLHNCVWMFLKPKRLWVEASR